MCKSETYVLEASFNPEEFVDDIKKAKAAVGEATEEDAQHLKHLVLISQVLLYGGHVLLLVGAAMPWGVATLLVCSLGACMIAFARCMKWAIIGHHVSHGGYDSVQKSHPEALPSHYKRGVFAIGFRRFFDWLDWMLPQAWDVEHNKAHHYYLSEEKDPDLVEHNFELMRDLQLPKAMKYMSMLLWVFTWKLTYYSPNTYKELALSKKDTWLARNWPSWGKKTDPVVVFDAFRMPVEACLKGKYKDALYWIAFFAEWSLAVLPMVLSVALPAVWPLLLGRAGLWLGATTMSQAAIRALVTSIVADMLSNAHAFIIIACNHSGGDLYRYSTSCKAYSAEFLLRCAYFSANFECGMIWLISSTDGSTTRLSITCFQTWLLCSTGSSSHLSRAFARSTAWCTCRRMPWSAPGWCFKWLWVMQPWSDVPLWCHRKLMEKTRLKLKVPKIPKSQVHETRSNWICDISARQAATPSSKKRMVKWAAHASNWQPALSLQLSVSLVSLVLRLVRRHHHCPLLWKSLFVAGRGRIWPCSEETSNGGRAPDWLWPRFSIADVVGSIVITFLTFVLQACHTAQSSISVYFSRFCFCVLSRHYPMVLEPKFPAGKVLPLRVRAFPGAGGKRCHQSLPKDIYEYDYECL